MFWNECTEKWHSHFSTFQVVIIAHVTAKMDSPTRHQKEKYFLTSIGENGPTTSLHDPCSRELSVVIPAYNEELRSELHGLLSQQLAQKIKKITLAFHDASLQTQYIVT